MSFTNGRKERGGEKMILEIRNNMSLTFIELNLRYDRVNNRWYKKDGNREYIVRRGKR